MVLRSLYVNAQRYKLQDQYLRPRDPALDAAALATRKYEANTLIFEF